MAPGVANLRAVHDQPDLHAGRARTPRARRAPAASPRDRLSASRAGNARAGPGSSREGRRLNRSGQDSPSAAAASNIPRFTNIGPPGNANALISRTFTVSNVYRNSGCRSSAGKKPCPPEKISNLRLICAQEVAHRQGHCHPRRQPGTGLPGQASRDGFHQERSQSARTKARVSS